MKDPEEVLRPYYHKALSNEKQSQARDNSRNLEFLEAVWEGEEDKVKDLIRDGIALSTETVEGENAADMAVERGHLGVLRTLIEARMDLRVDPARSWKSVIHDAARRGQVEMVEMMLDAGIDIESEVEYFNISETGRYQNYWLPTVLSVATISRQIPTAQMLLDRGAKVDAPNQVEHLFINGHIDVVRILALRDIDHPHTYAFGATILHLVAVKHKCLIEELIDKGSDINAKDLEGRTPLSYALGRHSFARSRYPFAPRLRNINKKAIGLLLYQDDVSEADLAAMPPELLAEYDWRETRRRIQKRRDHGKNLLAE